MPPEQAKPFYNEFLEMMKKKYKPELIKGNLINTIYYIYK